MDRTIVVAKRYSYTEIESATNDQPENTFKVQVCRLHSAESHFMVAEADLHRISQLKAAILVNNPALADCRVIIYYFDRNGAFVMMSTQANFDMFLSTRINQHIYVLEIPPSLSQFDITMCDSQTIFEFAAVEVDTTLNTSTDSDLSTHTEKYFEFGEEPIVEIYVHTQAHEVRAG